MLPDRPFTLDRFVPLLAVELKDGVEGFALHTSRRTVKLIVTRGGKEGLRGGLCPLHLP